MGQRIFAPGLLAQRTTTKGLKKRHWILPAMTPDEAAHLLTEILQARGYLDQEIAAYELAKRDKSFVYHNEAGNLAVAKEVLAAFRRAMPDDVVWSRGERHWRFRKTYDRPGRMQD
jgi:hypothetical protein